jgi:hypothetical protein
MAKSLLSINVDPKTAKSNLSGLGYYTAIHYGAPHKLSGFNACASASPDCVDACLHTAGNPVYQNGKNKARIERTLLWFRDRPEFIRQLMKEITAFCRLCDLIDLKPAIRLNGTTDLYFERYAPELFDRFPQVQFYDYTKHLKRMRPSWALPGNYHLTFSRSEENQADCLELLRINPRARVSVVFDTRRTKELPLYWQGYRVGDCDRHDLRFLDVDPICGLRAKGKARNTGHDENGFIVSTEAMVASCSLVG